MEDNVFDTETPPPPGQEVTHTDVDADIFRVEAVTTPGAHTSLVTLPYGNVKY